MKESPDLFDYSLNEQLKSEAPLADRLRPRTLDEFVGQPHILSAGRLLRRAIQADQLSSLIFFGPPGTGKTTLARIIANTTKAQFISLNAVLSGVKDIRAGIASAEQFRKEYLRKTILFIDEVHRFNKAQQDALLPHVENGTVILIGATTENPYFEVNKALVSRSRVFQLKSLENKDLELILGWALIDKERGYGNKSIILEDSAKKHLVQVANGDARAVLNALELAVETSEPDDQNQIHINLEVAEESIQRKAVLYDKDGDAHFDTISAFIKSMRGSDPDAALYWMAKMVYGGEDPRFLFRRMIIFAAEDIGMADPQALQVAVSASQAFDYVGMPEGRFHLAQACIYLSTAPKSNSGFAFFDALEAVQNEKNDDIPNHLKDGNRDKEGLGHGKGYLYPHAYQDHWVAQQYLPDLLQGRVFYQPTSQGFESRIKDDVIRQRETQLAAVLDNSSSGRDAELEYWQGRTLSNTAELLSEIRDLIFAEINQQPHQLSLILNSGDGVLLGEMVRSSMEGTVYGHVRNEREKEFIDERFSGLDYLFRPIVFISELTQPLSINENDIYFDWILGRNFLSKKESNENLLVSLSKLMSPNGKLVFAESIPAEGQRLSAFIDESKFEEGFKEKIMQAEEQIYQLKSSNHKTWNTDLLTGELNEAGFRIQSLKKTELTNKTIVSPGRADEWFSLGSKNQKSYADYLSESLSDKEIEQIHQYFLKNLVGRVLEWKYSWLIVKAELKP